MSDVNLQLFEAGRLSDVARRVVGGAVAAAHRVVIVAVTHDVTHAAGNTHTQITAYILFTLCVYLYIDAVVGRAARNYSSKSTVSTQEVVITVNTFTEH